MRSEAGKVGWPMVSHNSLGPIEKLSRTEDCGERTTYMNIFSLISGGSSNNQQRLGGVVGSDMEILCSAADIPL